MYLFDSTCKHKKETCIMCTDTIIHGFEEIECFNCNVKYRIACRECLETDEKEKVKKCEYMDKNDKYCDGCIEKFKDEIYEYLLKNQNLEINQLIDIIRK